MQRHHQKASLILLKVARSDVVGRADRIEGPETLAEQIDAALFFLQQAFDNKRL